MNQDQVKQYLNRISISKNIDITYTDLTLLMQQHLLSIPFENLYVHYHIPILLNEKALFDKVIINKMGGFCYELNYLFYHLLTSIGFEVSMYSAQVYNARKESYGPAFDHLFLIVTIDNIEYIVDVGFGESSFLPVCFELDLIQDDDRNKYVIRTQDKFHELKLIQEKEEKVCYKFQKIKRQIEEFDDMCLYHQQNTESIFTQNRLITIATEKGRITYSNNVVTIKEGHKIVKEYRKKIDGLEDVHSYFRSLYLEGVMYNED